MRDFGEELAALRARVAEAERYLRIPEARTRLPALEAELARPDLWDDPATARRVQSEHAALSDDLAVHASLQERLDDAEVLHELAREEGDDSQEGEIAEALAALAADLDELELRSLFTGDYDEGPAVVEVNSGAGGTDAQDWANMLLRMYLRWAERKGFSVELDSVSPGQEAGISTAQFIVEGRYAYGLLRAEHGVHRLVRISPFDNNARRQTAFASVRVTPFVEDAVDAVQIDDKDLRIDTYRSSGAGGQHVNVTDSAVRITHLPTGIVVACQNERSQHQNKDRAMQVLAARLLERERAERQARIDEIAGESAAADFGSQDRNYVLHPYQQVKDLRTGLETSNVDAVLDGELDGLMEAWLRWTRATAGTTA